MINPVSFVGKLIRNQKAIRLTIPSNVQKAINAQPGDTVQITNMTIIKKRPPTKKQ